MQVQRVKGHPAVGVLRPDGPIDYRNVAALQAATSAARRRGLRSLVLDLSDTRYINSLGLSYLVSLSDAMAVDGGALLLAEAPPKLKIVLDLMGVGEMLPLHRSVAAAVRSVLARRPLRGA